MGEPKVGPIAKIDALKASGAARMAAGVPFQIHDYMLQREIGTDQSIRAANAGARLRRNPPAATRIHA